MKRLFIVGFPRSGTTLLQSVIMSNFCLSSTEETHYYFDKYFCPLERLNLDPVKADRLYLPRLTRKYDRVLQKKGAQKGISLKDFMDEMAKYEENKGWIEKTPGHIRRIPVINNHVPDALFIHIVRRVRPVTRSWQKAGIYTKAFREEVGDIERMWSRDVMRTINCMNSPGHLVLPYEAVVEKVDECLNAIETHIGIDRQYGSKVLDDNVAGKIIRDDEMWKSNNRLSSILSLKDIDKEKTNDIYENLYSKVMEKFSQLYGGLR